ncbi:MAG: hypothetical protein JXC32_20645 [Anaerolineae bacterium]|nr:hypothetical protein [Anaerolineae bacterium]
MPGTIYYPIWFADQDWRKPNRAGYMTALAEHRPVQATVLDLEREEQLSEVLGWAEEAAQYVERVVIIPKAFGIIDRIPAHIASAEVVLGYSVPTRYAGTEVPVWEFGRRPVHLLGGRPSAQLRLSHYLNVVSADGNYANLKATQFCQWWDGNRWRQLLDDNGNVWGRDAIYEAFRRSCESIIAAWQS